MTPSAATATVPYPLPFPQGSSPPPPSAVIAAAPGPAKPVDPATAQQVVVLVPLALHMVENPAASDSPAEGLESATATPAGTAPLPESPKPLGNRAQLEPFSAVQAPGS